MQQRRVRLGDVLDDYCPRERRITNHAVVAMIDDEVKQTRCATCDAEHVYKAARVPAARRKKPGGALSADVPEGLVRPRASAAAADPPFEDEPGIQDPIEGTDEPGGAPAADPLEASPDGAESPVGEDAGSGDEDAGSEDEGSQQDDWVHRPLIRATLPRQEGQVPERKAPDFTMRQPGRFDNHRNGQRHRSPRAGQPGQGQFRRAQGQPSGSRVGGPGQPRGPGQGPRHGQGSRQAPGQGTGPNGNRSGSTSGQRGGRRPAGQLRGPRQGSGPGRKRGR